MMNNFFQRYGALVVVALILVLGGAGYVAYQQYKPQGSTENASKALYAPSGSQANDEMRVLNIPGPNASREERSLHYRLAQSLVKDVEYLDITGCKANPTVTQVKLGAKVKVKNQDAQEHTITLNRDHQTAIPANGINAVNMEFYNGKGLYSFRCDDSTAAVGLFMVVE